MRIKKAFVDIIKKFDLFSKPVTFRYNQQPQFESVTGGIVSILLIIVFIAIFSTTLFRTLNKQYINFNLSHHDMESPSYFATTLENTFMFAIGIDGIDLNSGQRYFDVYMQKRYYTSGSKDKTSIPLIPCNKEEWNQRGYATTFEKLSLSKWLCPMEGTKLQFEGKFTSEVFQFYKIAVTKCDSTLDPSRPCASDATIQAYLDANQAFSFNYYFINTIINPGDDAYLKTYLEDRNYFPFSPTDGINANLFISSYIIQTDESLYPNENIQTDEGGIVLDSAQVMNYKVRSKEYLKLFLRKSPIALTITRSFRKVDDTFSYIGGLFGTILVFFGFLGMYNELAYEIEVSRNAYYFGKNDPFDGQHFNILIFFPYVLFEFLDRFGITLPWPRLQRLHKFLEEGKKQLDMRLIVKKILYAEKLGLTVLDKSKHKALLLSEPFTLDQADEIRKDLNFYRNFRRKFFPNGESAQQNEQMLLFDPLKKQAEHHNKISQQTIQASKVFPFGGDTSVVEPSSTEYIEMTQAGSKKLIQPKSIEDEHQFAQLDFEIRECLERLRFQAANKDEMAKKLLENIDPRIKKRYLKNEKIGAKKKLKPINPTVDTSNNTTALEIQKSQKPQKLSKP